MKQKERNRLSRERILEQAFAEFAKQGYLGASVNTICTQGKISKGLLYHYYADKDALYLACAQLCFQDLTAYLKERLWGRDIQPDEYFNARLEFFGEHPMHQRLFCDIAVNPPRQLGDELAKCRASFDALNESLLTTILETQTLAEGLTVADAIFQLRLFEDCFSTYLKKAGEEVLQVERHNQLAKQTFHTMLYGLIAR